MQRSNRVNRFICAFVLAAFTLAGLSAALLTARAATLTVTNLADSGAGSLRAVINSAAANDTVVFAPGLAGTINFYGGQINLTRNIIITGHDGIILDGLDSTRHFNIGSNAQVTLNNLTLQRGSGTDGGAIAMSSGLLIMNDCILRDNHASTRGGALIVDGVSRYILNNTLIADNEARDEGGAIFDAGGNGSVISDSTISGNISVSFGGGIRHVSGDTLTINRSLITGNQVVSTSTLSGGGIATQSGVLNINDSTIASNKAHFAGGIYVLNIGTPSQLNLNRSLVVGNTAISDGGGMFVFGGTLVSTNSTFANNIAGSGGGGGLSLQNSGESTASVALTNNTFAYNRATSNGGGLSVISGSLTLENTIAAGNIAPTNPDLQGTFTSLGYNVVQTRGSSVGYSSSDLPNGTNPILSTVAFNGGPTNTMNLNTGSPAIDVIPAANCAGITTDQRGYLRPTSGTCDIGAVETNGVAPTPTPTITPTSTSTYTPTATATSTATVTSTATATSTAAVVKRPDTPGLYNRTNALWQLRNSNSAGVPSYTFNFGPANDPNIIPLVGDWNGDGVDTFGLYVTTTGAWILSNDNSTIAQSFIYGAGFTPVVGDWDGNGSDTVGIYNPANSAWILTNVNGGAPTISFPYGVANAIPLTGDWDGDGDDTPGVYNPGNSAFILSNALNAAPFTAFPYGDSSLIPVEGDWNADTTDTVGMWNPATGTWLLINQNASVAPQVTFVYGAGNSSLISLAGVWPSGGNPPIREVAPTFAP